MTSRYALPGSRRFPQVEPEATFWVRTPVPRAVSLEEVRRELDHRVPEFDESSSAEAQRDLAEVRRLANGNEDEALFQSEEALSMFLRDSRYIFQPLPQRMPTPVYPPPGSVFNRRQPIDRPFLKYGAELGRLFENETPGLWHRHVLNIILDPTVPNGLGQKLSPPRQALIWAALDVAISSALQAAWYYKWFSLDDRRVSFRERPWEAAQDSGNPLPVLYDYMIAYDANGDIRRGALRTDPQPTPGTPRHPAYPSGHSTYSAAASAVLGCLLPRYRASFLRLANNIGRARIWAGVHWLQDHLAGQIIGAAVGRLVVDQLNRSGISVMPAPVVDVPIGQMLRKMEDAFYARWREGSDFCRGLGRAAVKEPDISVGDDDWMMNPGGFIEGEEYDVELLPVDEDGVLDAERDTGAGS